MKYSTGVGIRIAIQGCPASGFPALDYRRKHGLPEALDDRLILPANLEVTEEEARALVEAGYRMNDAGHIFEIKGLGHHFCPCTCTNYGHYATIPVSPEDSQVTLRIRAALACREEQYRHEIGADKLEEERKELQNRIAAIDAKLNKGRQ